jgi:hypothetical protein
MVLAFVDSGKAEIVYLTNWSSEPRDFLIQATSFFFVQVARRHRSGNPVPFRNLLISGANGTIFTRDE